MKFVLRNFREAFFLAPFLLLWCAASAAQGGGSIRGNVLLPTGAYLNERARITLLVDRGVKSSVYTDDQGRFQFTGLTPAIYEIVIEPDGNRFEKSRTKVEVFPGAPSIINISLIEKKGTESTANNKVVSAGELDQEIPSAAKKEFTRAGHAAAAGKVDEAIVHFRKAIEIYPKYLLAHNDLGVQLLAQAKLDDAATEFRRAIEIDAKAFNPRLNLGIVLVQQQKYVEALPMLQSALAVEPDSPAAILYDGLAKQGTNDSDGAEREFLLAHNLGGSQFAKALFHLGQIYLNKGQRKRAAEMFDQYLSEEPNGPEAPEARRLLKVLR